VILEEPQRTATFTLQINQERITSELLNEYRKRFSALMHVDSSRLSLHPNCPGDELDSILNQSNTTFLTYYLQPDLAEENADLAPIQLVRSFNRNQDAIRKFIPLLEAGDFLLLEEVKAKNIYHAVRPFVIDVGYTYIAFNVSATTCGRVFGIVEPLFFSKWFYATNSTIFAFENNIINGVYSPDVQFFPYGESSLSLESNSFEYFNYSPFFGNITSSSKRLLATLHYSEASRVLRFPATFQLGLGLNSSNIKVDISFSETIKGAGSPVTINVTNLTPNTVHNIYIGFANNNPIPTLLKNDFVAQINIKTLRRVSLIISSSQHLQYQLRTTSKMLRYDSPRHRSFNLIRSYLPSQASVSTVPASDHPFY
jgi:hypothetical protein